MPCPVIYWEVTVRDLRRQQSFYSQIFDWEISGRPGQAWFAVNTGMSVGTVVQGNPPANEVTLVVQVDDVPATVDKAIRLGARVVNPPASPPEGGMLALIRDPEGNLVWLSKPGQAK
jgi:predicted enzyme related to lactoylglutathione lyase